MTKKSGKVKKGAANKKAATEMAKKQSVEMPFENGLFTPLQSLRREVDEMFGNFASRFDNFSGLADHDFKIPAMNVDETETEFKISAEMPGVAEEDIDISLTDTMLTICGEKQTSKETSEGDRRVSECSYSGYERSMALPFAADAKDITAEYKNGVLNLTIPKPQNQTIRSQKVEIQSAA